MFQDIMRRETVVSKDTNVLVMGTNATFKPFEYKDGDTVVGFDVDLSYEIAKSIEFIGNIGGDPNNWTICYPYGNYNEDTIDLLKQHGCKLGLTTKVDLASPNDGVVDGIYKLPRLDVNDLPKDANAEPNQWYI